MKIQDITKIKNRPVITIGPDATAREAMLLLLDNKIGALPVCDKSNALLGIVSERDLLRTCAKGNRLIDDVKVENIMTKDIVIAVPDDELDYISEVMIQQGIRHMPVMAGPKLNNMISIRDIVNAQLEHKDMQVRSLNAYISGGFV